MLSSNFSNKFYILLNTLRSSISYHVTKIITWNLTDVWFIIFSSDPTNISLCVRIDIGYKSIVKWKFCAQPMHQILVTKYCILQKLIYQNKKELPVTSMAFMMIASRFEKSHCLLKSSVPSPWQPNLIKTLATGAISKLTIQTSEPIPTYTLLNPICLL